MWQKFKLNNCIIIVIITILIIIYKTIKIKIDLLPTSRINISIDFTYINYVTFSILDNNCGFNQTSTFYFYT